MDGENETDLYRVIYYIEVPFKAGLTEFFTLEKSFRYGNLRCQIFFYWDDFLTFCCTVQNDIINKINYSTDIFGQSLFDIRTTFIGKRWLLQFIMTVKN